MTLDHVRKLIVEVQVQKSQIQTIQLTHVPMHSLTYPNAKIFSFKTAQRLLNFSQTITKIEKESAITPLLSSWSKVVGLGEDDIIFSIVSIITRKGETFRNERTGPGHDQHLLWHSLGSLQKQSDYNLASLPANKPS